MESTQGKVRHIIYANVANVYEAKENARGYKDDLGQAVIEERTLGWFVHFYGSMESIYFGDEKPDYEIGDIVKITFEKQEPVDAQPQQPSE